MTGEVGSRIITCPYLCPVPSHPSNGQLVLPSFVLVAFPRDTAEIFGVFGACTVFESFVLSFVSFGDFCDLLASLLDADAFVSFDGGFCDFIASLGLLGDAETLLGFAALRTAVFSTLLTTLCAAGRTILCVWWLLPCTRCEVIRIGDAEDGGGSSGGGCGWLPYLCGVHGPTCSWNHPS